MSNTPSKELQEVIDKTAQLKAMLPASSFPEIDCRQCEKYKNGAGEKWCGVHIKPCTNGDKFVKLPVVQLWRKG
jgi:hypothetical protein